MFSPISNWSVFVWNIFSVMSIDHNKWRVIYSSLLMMSCVYTIYVTPQIVCVLDRSCDNSTTTLLKGMFTMVVSVTGFISRLVILLKGKTSLVKYKKNIDNFHIFTPMNSSEENKLKKFSSQIVLCSILLVIPLNVMKLWIIWDVAQNINKIFMVINFILIYLQNFSMFCIETHFTVLCFILYQKFVGINKDLLTLKISMIMRYKYPFVSHIMKEKNGQNNYSTVEYNNDILNFLASGYLMTDCIEKLKIKHKLARDAINNLNSMFGIHLGFSLCSLSLYAMFDLYYYIRGVWDISKSKILIFGWILQYAVRFLIVTVLAHVTTKQVI